MEAFTESGEMDDPRQWTPYEVVAHVLHLQAELPKIVARTLKRETVSPALRADLETLQQDVVAIGLTSLSQRSIIQRRHLEVFEHKVYAMCKGVPVYSSLKKLSGAYQTGPNDPEIMRFVSEVQNSLSNIYGELENPRQSLLACSVFGLPEILEMVLSYCGIPDVLNMSATCKDIDQMIKGSPRLQYRLFTKPDPRKISRIPFELSSNDMDSQLLGLECEIDYDPWDSCRKFLATITVRMDSGGVYWPKIGKRFLDMFVCQPPIQRLLVHGDYDLYDEMLDEDCVQLFSEKGLTIGDLYQAARELVNDHDVCGDVEDSDDGGPALYSVEFRECLSEEAWSRAGRRTAR